MNRGGASQSFPSTAGFAESCTALDPETTTGLMPAARWERRSPRFTRSGAGQISSTSFERWRRRTRGGRDDGRVRVRSPATACAMRRKRWRVVLHATPSPRRSPRRLRGVPVQARIGAALLVRRGVPVRGGGRASVPRRAGATVTQNPRRLAGRAAGSNCCLYEGGFCQKYGCCMDRSERCRDDGYCTMWPGHRGPHRYCFTGVTGIRQLIRAWTNADDYLPALAELRREIDSWRR